MKNEEKPQNLEEEVFKTLAHQVRRDILRVVGEEKKVTFTEIKRATGIQESASLSYHLNELGPLLSHKDGTYQLSELGRDAFSLLTKLITYSSSAAAIGAIRKQIGSTIIANALLWASALGYLLVVESPLEFMTISVFVSLFVVSNIILYGISLHTKSG